MELVLLREMSSAGTTFGELLVEGEPFCLTLEDEVREVAGRPVDEWKIHGETAIPAGSYRITLENSPRFGPNTLTVSGVPGFAGVRIHSGSNKNDTEGCIILGDKLDRATMTIAGGLRDHVVDNLKCRVSDAIDDMEAVWLTIKNPE
jgi:hypothetical protein